MLDAVRSALRHIRSHPGFAAAVVLTIAVGVGATTAVFTLADRMLFRPLPFPEPERLIRLRQQLEGRQALLRVGDYLRLERDHQGLESITEFGLQRPDASKASATKRSSSMASAKIARIDIALHHCSKDEPMFANVASAVLVVCNREPVQEWTTIITAVAPCASAFSTSVPRWTIGRI